MRRDAGSALVLGLVVVAAVFFVSWEQNMSAARKVRQTSREAAQARMNAGYVRGNPGSLGPFPSVLESRLLVTLADQAGPYTVSVRYIRPEHGDRPRFTNGYEPTASVGPFYVILQVLANERDLSGVSLEPSSLKAVDDTGRPVRYSADPLDTPAPMPLDSGRVYIARMSAPAESAQMLRWLTGFLHRSTRAGASGRIPFRIENVPLPTSPRICGRSSPRIVPAVLDRELPAGLVVRSGDDGERLYRRSRPLTVDARFLPQHILLGAGHAARMGVPTPASGRALRLMAQLGLMGAIHLEAAAGAERWSGRVWDDETTFVALPREPGRARLGVAMRLTRESAPRTPVPDPAPPFPAPAGKAGGALTFSVRVARHPFGSAVTQVRIWRRENGQWDGPRVVLVPVRENGDCVLANLAAGEYRIDRPAASLLPILPRGEPAPPLPQYLDVRFDAREGRWVGEQVQDITVREGQQTIAPPLQWRPSAHSEGARSARSLGSSLL